MLDVGLRRVTRTRFGRAVCDALERLGVTGTPMYVYAASLDEGGHDRETPSGVTLSTVRASEVDVWPDQDFADLADSDFAVLARGESGDVLGWVFLTLERPVEVAALSSTVRFDGAYLWHLFVEPAARGRGVASALVDEALSFAARDRVDAAYALVATGNVPSRRVFEAHGFEVVDEVSRSLRPGRRRTSPPPAER